jgi:hypothetical protein
MNDFLYQYVIYPHHFSGPSMALICLSMLLILAFEVWMLVDVLAYRKVPARSRLWWVVGMFLIHPFVAMAYILVRSRYKKG